MSAQSAGKKRVVIIGGGFGGLNAAKVLGKDKALEVIVIDRRNYHLFQPLLYQVALAALSPADIAAPIRSILRKQKNTRVLLGNVYEIRTKERELVADFGTLSFDYLVLACGAKHSYFGHDGWEEYAPGLKTIEQATEIRRRVLLAFEMAEREPDVEKQKQWLTFVIVGGGPTGVELAGAIGEISRHTLVRDFRNIDPARTRIILIEAGRRILASFDGKLARDATRDLENLGVQVWTNSLVTEISEKGVSIGAEFVRAATVIWAAGVEPSSLNKTLGTALDKQGRVMVGADLSLPGFPNIFVIGDQANSVDERSGKPLPGLAPVAIQQGRFVGKLIRTEAQGNSAGEREHFKYFDKGQMATIGRNKAIAQTPTIKMEGFLAWLGWIFVHIRYLVGYKNKVLVLIQWAWSYASYKRAARLIISKDWRGQAVKQQYEKKGA